MVHTPIDYRAIWNERNGHDLGQLQRNVADFSEFRSTKTEGDGEGIKLPNDSAATVSSSISYSQGPRHRVSLEGRHFLHHSTSR
jgi:hypothetical protein